MTGLDATESKDGLSLVVGALVPVSFLCPKPGSTGLSGHTQRKCDQVTALSTVSTSVAAQRLGKDPGEDAQGPGVGVGGVLLKSTGHQALPQASGRRGDPSPL